MPEIKTEAAKRLAQVHDGLTFAKAKEVYAHVVEIIADVAKDKSVVLPGIGSIKVVDVDERSYRNPKGGPDVIKPAHKKYRMKGKEVK
jgi:nucleoid DNA-binding protein